MARPFIEIRRKRDVVAVVIGTTLFSVAISVIACRPLIAELPPEFQSKLATLAIALPTVCALTCSSALAALLYRATIMRDEMARMAVTDVLTGVYNRRGFFQKANTLLADGGKWSYDAFVIDLDFFKRINDRYGHEAGDKVLAEVGRALADLFGGQDVVGRTGGEEFIVLAHREAAHPPFSIAEAIRERIMELRVPAKDGAISVTASVGYTPARSLADLDAALIRADHALYRAKERGRNRVEAALAA